MKITIKFFLLISTAMLLANPAFSAGRSDNLKVLSDKEYRSSLEEIVVTAQTQRRNPELDRTINIEPSPTRLQWLPKFDHNSPESIKPRSESDEKSLIKIFEKKF